MRTAFGPGARPHTLPGNNALQACFFVEQGAGATGGRRPRPKGSDLWLNTGGSRGARDLPSGAAAVSLPTTVVSPDWIHESPGHPVSFVRIAVQHERCVYVHEHCLTGVRHGDAHRRLRRASADGTERSSGPARIGGVMVAAARKQRTPTVRSATTSTPCSLPPQQAESRTGRS